MSDKDKNIELRSDEIQDILGKVPPWLIRSGITGLSLVIVFLIFIAAIFKYPDRIVSEIQLTTENPPVHLVSRTTAKISEFFTIDKQEVQEGELLVVLESGADYRDVVGTRDLVESLPTSPQNVDTVMYRQLLGLKDMELGNLQGEFAALQKSVQTVMDFLSFDKYEIRIKGKEEEARSQTLYYNRLYGSKNDKERELNIAKTQFDRSKELHDDGTYSDLQFEEAESNYLVIKGQYEQARLEMASAQVRENQLQQQINELKIDRVGEQQEAFGQIHQSKDKFLGALADWEQTYLLISPTSGIVSLGKFRSVYQEVKQDSRVLTIVQETSGEIIGKLVLPSAGAGKVAKDQNVIIRFDRYPYMEFGMVTGVVNSIAVVPEENNYYVEVAFPDGLKTSNNQVLEFTQEMTGQAEIITEVRSFLVRVIAPLQSMLERNELNKE